MSHYCTIYETATGRIVSVMSTSGKARPPQGVLVDSPEMAVIHGKSDPAKQCVEHGKIVPKKAAVRLAEKRATDHFEMRKRRAHFLNATLPVTDLDRPMNEDERARIRKKRRASWSLDQKTWKPTRKRDVLERIWRDTDVV